MKEREEIIKICHRLYEKGLVVGKGGCVSILNEKGEILITSHGCCLGYIKDDDIVIMDKEGNTSSSKEPSYEKNLHLAIYKNFPSAKAVIHVHPPYTLLLAHLEIELEYLSFEEKFFLGKVEVIPQKTPIVTEIDPVISALNKNKIVILKNHGTVAYSDDIYDALFLTELLEQTAKMTILSKIIKVQEKIEKKEEKEITRKKYPLFSKEHIEALVDLINKDEEVKKLGEETNLTTSLAIKLIEENKVFNIHFEKGKVVEITQDENAEFVISGKKEVWKLIFKGDLDPFVAQTQKKLKLKGDIISLSKWYAPFYRIFDLWKEIEVE